MKWTVIGGALLAVLAITGCDAKQTYRWKEEVLLHDGRVIVIERNVKTGYDIDAYHKQHEVPTSVAYFSLRSDAGSVIDGGADQYTAWRLAKSFKQTCGLGGDEPWQRSAPAGGLIVKDPR